MDFPAKLGSVLLTPEPHFMPGYTGYCPQLKYDLGGTYGKLTSKLLSNTEAPLPRRLEDRICHLPCMESQITVEPHVIPGYTGFIPNSQKYFSKNYTATCREALAEYARDRRKWEEESASPDITDCRFRLPTARPCVPLSAVSGTPVTYMPRELWEKTCSPYYMEEGNPLKYYMSGFTGFVPKSRFLFGSSFPIITNKALVQFGKETKSGVKENETQANSIKPIYSLRHGQLPSYTGHVPGYRFRFGHTFGQLTHDFLGIGSAQRMAHGEN